MMPMSLTWPMPQGEPAKRRVYLLCEALIPHTLPSEHVPHHFVGNDTWRQMFARDECGCIRQYGGGF